MLHVEAALAVEAERLAPESQVSSLSEAYMVPICKLGREQSTLGVCFLP
jgi:hypothetical protein